MTEKNMQPQGGTSRRTIILALILTIVGLLHHTDHVLRADHSGWPFTPDVNPFTVSVILAYSISAFVLFVRGRLWAKFWLLLAGYIATQTAHIFIETPVAQYTTWALNASQDPETFGQPNLLDIASPLLGWVAVVISILLSVMLVATTVSAFVDARLATREQRKLTRQTSS